MFPAPDPSSELVELQQAEPVRVLDDHHRRVRHVDADLDDRRRDQDVELVIAKGAHHRLLVGRRHLPVQQAEPRACELVGGEALVLVGRGAHLHLGRPLDERADDVGLASGRDLGEHALVHARPLERARADDLRDDRRAPRRQLPQLGLVEVAVDEHRRGPRDRGRGHDEDVGFVPLPPEQVALLDTEAVLLVDDGEAEARELDALVDERVRADHDVDGPVAQTVGDAAPVCGAGPVREQLDARRDVRRAAMLRPAR